MASDLDCHVCWICGRAVVLENFQTDEQGFAVHEACYLARLALDTESRQAKQNTAEGHRLPVQVGLAFWRKVVHPDAT
jgi:hypothetical protein